MPAAPTKYTPERRERILMAIRQCATYALAAAFGGVDYDTFLRWRKRNRDFDQAVRQAEADAVMGLLMKINKAAEEQWQAAAWKLERRYPQDYGRRVQELQGKDGGPLQVVLAWPEDEGED